MARLKHHAHSLSVSELINHYGAILHAVRTNPVLREPLRRRGWTPEKTEEVKDLLDTFTNQHRAFEKARRERNALSETLDEELVTFQTGTYAEHTGLVDAVYIDVPDRRAALGTGDRPDATRSTPGVWARNVLAFYDRLLDDPQALAELQEVNLSREELDAARSEVQRLSDLYREREEMSTRRQDLRDRRDATRDLLIRAMRKLQKIALVLLGNENQALEDVGYVIPTHPATSSS